MMVYAYGRVNIVHSGSSRCCSVTQSVLATDLHEPMLGFDLSYVIPEMLVEILQQHIPMQSYVDGKTVFDVISKNAKTTDERLQMDVAALKESYCKGERDSIAWIPGPINAADGLTKIISICEPLQRMMQRNHMRPSPIGWAKISRKDKNPRMSIGIDQSTIPVTKSVSEEDVCVDVMKRTDGNAMPSRCRPFFSSPVGIGDYNGGDEAMVDKAGTDGNDEVMHNCGDKCMTSQSPTFDLQMT